LKGFTFFSKFCFAGALGIKNIHPLFGAAQLTASLILTFAQTE
jgi:hypothetical protein